jgi:hypothetical protein
VNILEVPVQYAGRWPRPDRKSRPRTIPDAHCLTGRMHRRGVALWAIVCLTLSLGACGGNPSTGTSTTTSTSLARVTTPQVTVTPSAGLTGGQQVQVRVTGFGVGGKVFLSECANAAAANEAGCGVQLAAQPFILTDESRNGSGTFAVLASASAAPYNNFARLAPCSTACVLVATSGIGGGFAYTTLSFAG